MMRWIVGSSLKLRLVVFAVAIALAVIGIAQIRSMPVDVLPEFAPPMVEIQTEALGLSAEEVEALITVPLEADLLAGVSWLQSIESESIAGLSSIVLIFEPGTDVMRARQLVQERLIQAHALPNVSKPPTMLQPLSVANRVMMVGLTSEELTPIEQSVLARWTIKPRLMGVPGVANVAIWGQRKRQLQVLVDPGRLQAENVTLQQVINTTGNALWVSPLSYLNASYPGTGGWIDTPNQRLPIRHMLPITTPEDLARVPIEGADMRLGDITEVVENHQPLIGDAIVDGGPGLLLVIEKFPGTNTLEVTRAVERTLETMKPGLAGLEIHTDLFRPASYIEAATANLGRTLLFGAALLLLVLVAFLFDWRTGLISLVAVPLSLVAALLVLAFFDVTFNAMVLLGLAIALAVVIHDAVVDPENIARRLQQANGNGDDELSRVKLMHAAAMEMRAPLAFAVVIALLAVMPLVFMEGTAGAFLRPLALAYAVAILASLTVAVTVTPALSMALLRRAPPEREASPLRRALQNAYDASVARTVAQPAAALGVAGVLLVGALVVLPQLRTDTLLPGFQENDIQIGWVGSPATSHPAMYAVMDQAAAELEALPGVHNVSAHLGRAVTSDAVVDVNEGELWVNLDPGADRGATLAAIDDVVAGYPGLQRNLRTYLAQVGGEALNGVGDTFLVRVYGDDLATLQTKAFEVRQALSGINGVAEAQVLLPPDKPNLEIEPDLEAAQQYGLKPGDVRRAAATLLSGIEVGSLFEEQKVFDVVVWGTPETRASVSSVRELLIDTPAGGQVQLQQVADIRMVPVPDVIQREEVSRRMDVAVTLGNRPFAAVAADVERALAGISFPLEFHAELKQDYAEALSARRTLLGFALAAIIGVFLLLQATFHSWRLATIAFVGLLAALSGGVLAIYLSGAVVTLGSLAGLLAVYALAVHQGVLLIRRFLALEHQEGMAYGQPLVQQGVRDRLMPMLASTLAFAAALLPMALFGPIAGLELLQPMALVALGGLATLALTNLAVVPALYARFRATPDLEFDFEFAPAAQMPLAPGRTVDATD